MNDPATLDISWRQVLRINGRFFVGGLSTTSGWLAWTNATPEWWGLWVIGALSLMGGVAELLRAGFETVQLIIARSRLRRFERKGRDQKADPIASDQDMVEAGRRK